MQSDHPKHEGFHWPYVLACAILFVMALIVGANAVRAADTGGPAPDLIPQIDTSAKPFSGGYVGAMISRPMQTTEVGGLLNLNAEDFGYGAVLGYDLRLANTNIVVGIKASYSKMGLTTAFADTDKSWDILGRFCFVVGQTTALCGLGGYTSTDGSLTVPAAIKFPDSGITFGLGAETYITKHLTASAELLWVDLGSSGGGMLENRMTVPRVGLNWRF
jgi:opacity protein-like surface antigen